MRRTMFVVPVEDAPILHAAASVGSLAPSASATRTSSRMLGVEDADAWLREAEAATLAALERRGEATAQELAAEVPALQEKVRVNVGKRYEGDDRDVEPRPAAPRPRGQVVRGRPRGTWISSQYRWAPMDRWLGRALPELPVDRGPGRARPALAGTFRARDRDRHPLVDRLDRARRPRRARERREPSRSTWTGRPGFVLPDDLEPTPIARALGRPPPLPGPDDDGLEVRDWYLGAHKDALFDTSGNAGPTIWVDGRIVGGWAIRPMARSSRSCSRTSGARRRSRSTPRRRA